MICLVDNKTVHGDLMCRNVLVFRCNSTVPEENLVKLTGFGLTKGSDIFSATTSSLQTTVIIPVRYAAPEILRINSDLRFYSEKSDVYSMAVLMWEACSYGTLPFSSLINKNDIIHCKLRGDHLPRPKICDEDLWLTIVQCWRLKPEERPTFKELRRKMMRLVHKSDSTASNSVLEAAKMSSNEQISSDNFEVLDEKIPCEYCDELINFDEYIIHTQREESNAASKALACTLNHLAVCEEYTLLSSAFIELATVQEQLEQVNSERTEQEFLLMNELLNEYLLHLDMVKYAFNERAKVHKRWLTTVDTFQKKQLKTGPQFEMEMLDLEKKITDDMQDYQQISMTLKQELEIFDQNRTEEFKNNMHAYIAQTLIQQEKVLNIWEAYLPIANNIDVTD
ncbi:unnamed protein product [Adineta steineri]|uniref:Protein kinase domain-containing protein n=1 Tax=Adineta steineri TaxID=433720 RepID=A0A814PPT1_9BILA|nr:unnamed protein product [Adineta steineri]